MKAKKSNKKSITIKKSRKEIRKDQRKQKKVRRAEYYSKKNQRPGAVVTNQDDDNKNNNENIKLNKKKAEVSTEDRIARKLENEKKQQERLAKQMEKKRKHQLIEDNEMEDKTIKRLEKQLRLNKRKNKSTPKSFTDDGLDYLLDFCDPENRKIAIETEKHLMGADAESDFEEDFAMMTGAGNDKVAKGKDNNNDAEDDDDDDDDVDGLESDEDLEGLESGEDEDLEGLESDEDEDLEGLESDEDDQDLSELNDSDDSEPSPASKKRPAKIENNTLSKKQKVEKKNNTNKQIKSDENDENDFNNDDDDDDEDAFDDDMEDLDEDKDDNDESESTKKNDDGTWEDIYGRKRDKDGNVITTTTTTTNKYIPPAARLKLLENTTIESEKISRLRKQLKGLINRLAEYNIHSIANQIEDLYMANSRNDMNELLAKLMMESIVAPVITPDRLIAEHMMLIAILHANIGTEVGAHFLLTIVKKFNEMINQYNEVENKELDNIVLMISHLYNFKVYGSQLLYQIIDILASKFNEKEIEIILLILKTVGFLLRKDDPISLKELIINLQQKASSSKSTNTRIQFMLEILMAIKNNNMSKIAQYDPSHIEHLKKMLKTILRKGNTVTQFNISLNDLLNVDERGKWWIVGSAWTGKIDNLKIDNKSTNNKDTMFSQKILDLADKQRMKGVKKDIFCILMTAEDYMDAFEKLHSLQAKDVIPVIINCCLQEKKFNLYYALLSQKLCDYDKKNARVFGLQLRDGIKNKLEILGEYKNIQIHNLAEFCANLIIGKAITLIILKDIEFTELDKPTMRFIRQLMIGILLNDNTESCVEAFEKISKSPNLKPLRDGLRFFISCFVVKNIDSKNLPENHVRKLKERADVVEKILLTRSGRIAF